MLHSLIHSIAPLFWVGVLVFAVHLRHRRKMAEIEAGGRTQAPRFEGRRARHHAFADQSGEIEALKRAHEREVNELHERLRVLERIATDEHRNEPSRKLAAEIEALRD